MKVLLRSTNNESVWKNIFIDTLLEKCSDIELYNPVFLDWRAEYSDTESNMSESFDTLIYLIVPEILELYVIAEAVDYSNKISDSVILCVLNENEFNKRQKRDIKILKDIVSKNRSTVVGNLKELIEEIMHRNNSLNSNFKVLDDYFWDGSGD